MRRFLYLTPYFPPQTRVGALRPLKFVRHLPEHGWAPVVLADLRPGDEVDPELWERVPATCDVVWDYSARAARTWRRFDEGRFRGPTRRPPGLVRRTLARLPPPRPELLPLGEHSPRMLHALRAARRAVDARSCEAILVNADPYAACLVGWKLGRELGLPVIHDLRDPWSLCDLRRPLRPAPQRRLVDWMERRCVEDCARFVLNTRAACEAYRDHYRDVPPGRFEYIRNHGDPGIFSGVDITPRSRFTMVHVGNFRRFVEGDVLLEMLVELRRRGLRARDIVLLVTGRLPDEARRRARRLGVEDMIEDHPPVPYVRVGAIMESADLLVSLSARSRMRIPAKLYDYAVSARPLLVVTDNPEVEEMVSGLGGVHVHGLADPRPIADAVEEEMEKGRRRRVERAASHLGSAAASARLAAVLDDVTRAGHPVAPR